MSDWKTAPEWFYVKIHTLAAPLSRTDWATDVALLYLPDYSYKPS